MDTEEFKVDVEQIIEEFLNEELEFEQFLEDTANIVIEMDERVSRLEQELDQLKHKVCQCS